jgi:fluoride exporter
MRMWFIIGAGGFIGAILRYLISGWVQHATARPWLPSGTLAVNAAGSFVVGLLFFLGEARGILSADTRAFAMIGLLGSFTTFSTFSLETMHLFFDGNRAYAVLNILANLGICLLAVLLARWLVLAVWE